MDRSSSTVLVGTQRGIYRVGEDSVVPLSTDLESVPSLSCPAIGPWHAGTGRGRIFRTGPDHLVWAECSTSTQDPREAGAQGTIAPTRASSASVESLLRLPGAASRVLALTSEGRLLSSAGDGVFELVVDLRASGESETAPKPDSGPRAYFQRTASLVLDPTREGSVLLAHANFGVCRIDHSSGTVETLLDAENIDPRVVLPHPGDPEVWMVAGRRGLVRTNDAGRTFRRVVLEDSAGPAPVGMRDLAVESVPGGRFLVLCDPIEAHPDRADRSSLWISSDAGQHFVALDPGPIDRPRDPCGELLCIALHSVGEARDLLFGTDRGELVRLRRGRKTADLLASDLPAILCIHRAQRGAMVDPSTSGIHLLP